MAAARKKPRANLVERTPVAEWVAAGLGLLLTLAVLGYFLREGLTGNCDPPDLSVAAEPVQALGGAFVLPLTVHNESRATAANVEVRGVLERGGQVIEDRRVTFGYVPGHGGAEGGLVFTHDPRAYEVRLSADGYEDP
jgi:uncharacterized protein (TIGR02588 family)